MVGKIENPADVLRKYSPTARRWEGNIEGKKDIQQKRRQRQSHHAQQHQHHSGNANVALHQQSRTLLKLTEHLRSFATAIKTRQNQHYESYCKEAVQLFGRASYLLLRKNNALGA